MVAIPVVCSSRQMFTASWLYDFAENLTTDHIAIDYSPSHGTHMMATAW